MRLVRTQIRNFRSIQDLTVLFQNGCEILIGVNESGKSNILKALKLLDPNTGVSSNDLRIGNLNEDPITKGHVWFVFQLSKDELEEIHNNVASQFLPETLTEPIVRISEKPYTLKDFVNTRNEGVYEVNLPSGKRSNSYWTFGPAISIAPGWKKLNDSTSHSLRAYDGSSLLTEGKKIFQSNLFEEVEPETANDFSLSDLQKLIGDEISRVVKAKIPQCVYWQYSEQYLLPSTININEFSSNPDSCLPLKSMFELAGIHSDQIGTTLTTIREQPHHRYLHLLDRVAAASTSHVHDVWQEHKGIKIELRPHGDLLIPVIQDKEVPLDMANRSEGFKRFVSFLLLVSAKVKTKQLSDTLILVDEPEIGLHPRGARNLMSELIKIGESNAVVYSTHSIFMVDRDHIDRHLVVEKKNELTTTWRAEKSKIQDEEVIYGAIGYSIFETLHQKNVIFEGWRDKQIFKISRDSVIKEEKELKESLDKIGLTFAEGVKDVRHVARFLELANRGCLIISDADAAGLQWQREYRRENGWGTWVTLQDILGPSAIVTAEDLLTPESIVRKGNLFRKQHPNLSELNIQKFSSAEPSHRTIANWLQEVATEDLPLKKLQDEFKNFLFEKIKKDELLEEAKKIVRFVAEFEFKIA